MQPIPRLYELSASDTPGVIYVGLTMNPRARLAAHRCGRGGNRGMRAWAAEIKARGATVRMRVVRCVPEERAADEEMALVAKHLARGAKLLNVVIARPAKPAAPVPTVRTLSTAEMYQRHPNWTQYAPPLRRPALLQRQP